MLLTLRHDCHELRDGESLGLDECLGLRDVGAKLLREHGRINFGQQIWKKELLFLFNYKNHIHIHSMNSSFSSKLFFDNLFFTCDGLRFSHLHESQEECGADDCGHGGRQQKPPVDGANILWAVQISLQSAQ